MAQSEFAGWINPLLAALKELGGSARPQEVVDLVAKRCSVTDAVLDQTITGGTSRFGNQVHWARYYLAEAWIYRPLSPGCLETDRKGAIERPSERAGDRPAGAQGSGGLEVRTRAAIAFSGV